MNTNAIKFFALALSLSALTGCPHGCVSGPPNVTRDAGATDAPPVVSDALEGDAREPVCEPEAECPPGWNWTPCGCATDNPDLLRDDAR